MNPNDEPKRSKTIGQTIVDQVADAWAQGMDIGLGPGTGGGALTEALSEGMDWAQKLAGNVFNIDRKNNQMDRGGKNADDDLTHNVEDEEDTGDDDT